MKKVSRKGDHLSEEERKKMIDKIISFFMDERDEEIGYIAAEDMLDFFLSEIGEGIYKKGVKDVKKLLAKWYYNLEVDLEVMEG